MDESQRAMVAAKLANMTAGKKAKASKQEDLYSVNLRNKPVSTAYAAKSMNVSPKSVEFAKKVIIEG